MMTVPSYLLSDTGCERNTCSGCFDAVKERRETGMQESGLPQRGIRLRVSVAGSNLRGPRKCGPHGITPKQ
jgi:hypothetical protein